MQGRPPIFLRPAVASRPSVELFSGFDDQAEFHSQVEETARSDWAGRLDVSRPGTAHLVGIGGSGMRALAQILADRGWSLSGSDLSTATFPAAMLSTVSADSEDLLGGFRREEKIRIHQGHAAGHLPDEAECVVYSEAIGPDNPELLAAAERGLPTFTCYEMIGRLMAGQVGIAVAGTHGKSTVTAMLAHVLIQAGKDPTVFCGATPVGDTTGGRAGSGPFVSEACEYREHFLHLSPQVGVILGIEPDHFDHFSSIEHLEAAFAQFAEKIPPDGLLLIRADCPAWRRVAGAARCRVETLAVVASDAGPACSLDAADWVARIVESKHGYYCFDLLYHGQPLAQLQPSVPGEHNLANALAAFAVAYHQGVHPNQIAESIETFPGLGRRLEVRGIWGGVTLVDDYAHHPTEVVASISTVRRMYPGRRLICVFQPHQTSRTVALLDEFVLSLQNVNQLWVADIFRAREDLSQTPTVTAADLADRVRGHGIEVSKTHRLEEIRSEITNRLECDDVLLTIGAGNVREVCDEFVFQCAKLHQKR